MGPSPVISISLSKHFKHLYRGKKGCHAKEKLVLPAVFNAVNGPSELLVLFFLFCPSASGSY